ncbi:cytochrome b561 [Clostridium tetanomorphum]|uniref:Uncharacterized protein n=1 Tax=Clostridium tetanomorphum TaxID=1553 RepID=A0A923E9V4_CLOTT|nr:hypothetical protein [Clostridium tetanomorphum]KAJ53881.1 hypothetical protein CTM_01400 [Clostridium tetanomorphum DSM 665]MBC2397396.1 hypothetical protein [Clostridium tetanomorphum]MBP1862616.1 cytochrome b561 [Clostridium tetanomorphum]NRS85543.1 cytochrome b561 [Clostridium tetanomorphum]NRZ96446.1 cytochrome b561 [Clostridium tetanomorphum]
MKEFKVLRIIDKFKWIFEKFGVDYKIMRKILQLKLTMDGRRVPTIMNNSQKKKENDDNKFFKSLWMYVLFGLILVTLVISNNNIMFQMSIFFGILMFMLITTFISDFSSVLLDIRDRNIMFTKPVNSKTVNAAKFTHILIYMFYITISLTGIALIVSTRHGIKFFIVLLCEIILVDMFMVALTALLYAIILKFFDGEKLKDIINYVQITLTLTITIGYQFIGRLFNIIDVNAIFTPKWWQYLIWPIWFAAPLEMVLNNNFSNYIIALSVFAIIIPCVAILIYIKLVPSFERNLQKLNDSSAANKKRNFGEILSKVVCFTNEERTFFKFAYNMIKNERQFKLKVYPSLGFAIVFPFIFMFNTLSKTQSFSEWLNYMPSTKYYFNIYFSVLSLPTVVMMMKYSERYKGAWIYRVMPLKNLAPVFKGVLKALLFKLIIPIYSFISLVFLFIFGIKIFPHLIIGFLNMMIFTIMCFRLMNKELPFSQSFQVTQSSEGLLIIPLMFVLAALGGIHFAITSVNFNIGIYVYMIVMLIAAVIYWIKALDIPYNKIMK